MFKNIVIAIWKGLEVGLIRSHLFRLWGKARAEVTGTKLHIGFDKHHHCQPCVSPCMETCCVSLGLYSLNCYYTATKHYPSMHLSVNPCKYRVSQKKPCILQSPRISSVIGDNLFFMNYTCVLNKVVSFDGKTELDFWMSEEMHFEATFFLRHPVNPSQFWQPPI